MHYRKRKFLPIQWKSEWTKLASKQTGGELISFVTRKTNSCNHSFYSWQWYAPLSIAVFLDGENGFYSRVVLVINQINDENKGIRPQICRLDYLG